MYCDSNFFTMVRLYTSNFASCCSIFITGPIIVEVLYSQYITVPILEWSLMVDNRLLILIDVSYVQWIFCEINADFSEIKQVRKIYAGACLSIL